MTALNQPLTVAGNTVVPDLQPDLDQAQAFIELLDPFDQFTFQTFDDDKERLKAFRAQCRDQGRKAYDPYAKLFHGFLQDHAKDLTRLNGGGAGVFVTVNSTDLKGRTADNIIRIRGVYTDLDQTNDIAEVMAASCIGDKMPTVVESSPGQFHVYWLTDGDDLTKEEFSELQEAFIRKMAAYGADPKVTDLPRVLRLPGFYHRKTEPFMTRIVHHGDRFTAEEIRTALQPFMVEADPKPKPSTTPTAPAGAAAGNYAEEGFHAAVKRKAMANFSAWVPVMFPTATPYQGGYRVESADLGRNLEEDLTFHPQGIRDFGEERGLTPINAVLKFCTDPKVKDANTAAFWLCDQMALDPELMGWTAQDGDALHRWKAEQIADEFDAHADQDRPRLLQSVGDLVTAPKPLEWTIRGVIEHGTLTLLFGESGGGKSYVTLSMALSVATGLDWYGNAVKQGPVVYIAGEGHSGISRRAKAWSIENNADLTGVPMVVSSRAVLFEDAGSLNGLITEIDAMPEPPKLVIIDTLARAAAGLEENSAKDMGMFIAKCDDIKHRYGCTVLVVHHTGLSDGNRARGSSAIKAALDVEIGLKKQGDAIVLTSEKMKEGEQFEPLGFRFKSVVLPAAEGWTDEHDFPIKTAVLEQASEGVNLATKDRPLTGAARVAHEAFNYCMEHCPTQFEQEEGWPMDGVTEEDWRQRCYQTGISDGDTEAKKKAFQRARKTLMDKDLLQCWEGHYY
ncbi:hypothetical protein CFI10_09435 [Marinobacterium iners]|uniref:AAA family ATPase n=1 Tax=Marinobacterium iners TaxID=48076 RepID=UPI001A8DE86A|nr:AAA family ATPase [Marinobacterium iners]QSR35215.1 hypothetical protein CFI10_09435 [Marinobacterium iners]